MSAKKNPPPFPYRPPSRSGQMPGQPPRVGPSAPRNASSRPPASGAKGKRPQPVQGQRPNGKKLSKGYGKASRRPWNLIGLLFVLGGIALLSATAGAFLAASLASTPLLQRRLTAEEKAVFGNSESIAGQGLLQMPSLTRPVNILVLGIKVLATEVANPPEYTRNLRYQATINSMEGLADTILLLRFNPQTQQLVIVSIPRDTRMTIPGYGVDKANVANVWGGPALSAKAVSDLLGGIRIDRYVRINVQGVEKLIDAVGGVTVYVPKDIKYTDFSQHLFINLKKGRQHLNGNQALQLLRFRYDELGDIGRIQRQQQVMRALKEQVVSPSIIARIPEIVSVIRSYIDTNLTLEELVALVGFGTQTSRSNLQMAMLPGDFSNPKDFGGVSFWLPDQYRIDQLISRYFGTGTSAPAVVVPSQVRIAIQDSTKNSAAVEAALQKLRAAGFTNVFVDQPWSEPLLRTRVVAQEGNVEAAQAVYDVLGFGEIRAESTGTLQTDVTILLGRDWQAVSPQ